MNTTSMAGYTLVARSMSTASVIDAVSDRWGAKLSTAHWMILVAGRRSNSTLSSASSASVKSSGVFGLPFVKLRSLMSYCSVGLRRDGRARGAVNRRSGRTFGLADLGLVRAGLVV